jgi:hypothetical protein
MAGLEKIRLHDELRSVVFGRIGTLKGTDWLPLVGTVSDTRQLMKIWDSDPNYENILFIPTFHISVHISVHTFPIQFIP